MLPGLRGLLGAIERIEKTGEGPGVSCVMVPPTKVPHHFAHHIGFAGLIPFLEEVNVNADRPGRADRLWPTATAVGKDAVSF